MAFKLTAAEKKQRDEFITTLNDKASELEAALEIFSSDRSQAWAALQDALEEYNSAVSDAWAKVTPDLEAYNDALNETREWRDDLVSRLQDEAEGKSERWSESEAGESANNWISELEGAELDDPELEAPEPLTIEEPEEVDPPELTHANTLEELREGSKD